MSPLERVECAYCDGIPFRTEATLLAERRAWVLWLCPDCAAIAEPIWLPSERLPSEVRNRLKKFNAQGD